jgi:hypothetical protein
MVFVGLTSNGSEVRFRAPASITAYVIGASTYLIDAPEVYQVPDGSSGFDKAVSASVVTLFLRRALAVWLLSLVK